MGRPAIGERAMTGAERQQRRRQRLKKLDVGQGGGLDRLLDRLAGMTDTSLRGVHAGRNVYEHTEYLINSICSNLGAPERQLPPLEEFIRFFRYMDRDEYEDHLRRLAKAVVHLQVLMEVARLNPPLEVEWVLEEEEDEEDGAEA